jgi:hypothetical protein
MKHLVVFTITATVGFLLYTELGISPVSEIDQEKYAIMGYLMALFAGFGTGLTKAVQYEFGQYGAAALLGSMFSLSLTNLIGIAMFGSIWQVAISFAPFVLAMWVAIKFSRYYIDTMMGFEQ